MIEIININKYIKENKLDGPITSSLIFMGKSFTLHSQGLHSEEIFGIDGSPERGKTISWIELNCNVIHPQLYDIISKRIEKNIVRLISGEARFNLDENGFLREDEEGELDGFTSFVENIHKLKFRGENEEGDRAKLIQMIYSNIKKNTFFMDKLLVISPDLRPITIEEETNEVTIDELNNLYQRVIIQSNQVKGVSGTLFDISSFQMQRILKELYEFVKTKTSKKQGLIRNQMLGKRVDFSARGVITPNPTLDLGEVGVPLKLCVELFEPFLVYGLVNSPASRGIPQEFHEELKSYLGKELDIDNL